MARVRNRWKWTSADQHPLFELFLEGLDMAQGVWIQDEMGAQGVGFFLHNDKLVSRGSFNRLQYPLNQRVANACYVF